MMKQKNIFREIFIKGPLSFAVGLAVGAFVFSLHASAQTGFPAPANPPSSNVSAPLNVSSVAQTKVGAIATERNFLVRNLTGATAGLVLENGRMGIKTIDPTADLDVNGVVRVRGGSPGAGKVLTSTDSNGNASWQPASGGAGSLMISGKFDCNMFRGSPSDPISKTCSMAPATEWSACYLVADGVTTGSGSGGCSVNNDGSNWFLLAYTLSGAPVGVGCSAQCIR